MLPTDLIRKKRDGGVHTRDEIAAMVRGFTRDDIPDYQMSAWLMAIVLRGMDKQETADLTDVMLKSGGILDLSSIPGKKVDKHSTGGVGDKTSFLIAPIVAAGGLTVPMISGRGLGHTGGTLDKLESIGGFNVTQLRPALLKILKTCGCAMIGQSAEIVPADKKMYALRDVTGTVESPALICASIMSKKLAEGIDALVLDVKTGSGAFMKREDDAVHLAELLVETGERMGKHTAALITDMDQPLGRTVGNALEILECVEVLRGDRNPLSEDLRLLSLELAGWMFYLAARTPSVADGKVLAEEMLVSGHALAKFKQMLSLQGGGDVSVADKPSRLPQSAHRIDITSRSTGYLQRIECEQVGIASLMLGGGRSRKDDVIDHSVGIVLHKKVGDHVFSGDPLCTIHYNAEDRLQAANERLRQCFTITADAPAKPRPLVRRIIEAKK